MRRIRGPAPAVGPAIPVACPRLARLRLFAAARQAAGTTSDTLPGRTVGDVLDAAVSRYGSDLAGVLQNARVWLNGDPAERGDPVRDDDEVAVLPPVSGGT